MADTYLQDQFNLAIYEKTKFAVNTGTQSRLSPDLCAIILPVVQAAEGETALLEMVLAQSIDLQQTVIVELADSQVIYDLFKTDFEPDPDSEPEPDPE